MYPVPPKTMFMRSEIAKHTEWTPGQWTEEDSGDSQEEYHVQAGEDADTVAESESLVCAYIEALSNFRRKISLSEEEKEICIDKAIEGCQIVCEVIAPHPAIQPRV